MDCPLCNTELFNEKFTVKTEVEYPGAILEEDVELITCNNCGIVFKEID